MPSRSGSPPRGALARTQAQRAGWLRATRPFSPGPPAGRCSRRQRRRVGGGCIRSALSPKLTLREVIQHSTLVSTRATSFLLLTESKIFAKLEGKQGVGDLGAVVCWMHPLKRPQGDPKGCRSPPFTPLPHPRPPLPTEFQESSESWRGRRRSAGLTAGHSLPRSYSENSFKIS